MCDLVDVGTRGFADSGEGVDRRDPLREHGIGGQLGQLGRPESHRQDVLERDPVRVHVDERAAGALPGLGLQRADEDAVGVEEVGDRSPLREELGVGEDVEPTARFRVRLQDGPHRLRRPTGHRRLLDHDFGRRRDLGDTPGRFLHKARLT